MFINPEKTKLVVVGPAQLIKRKEKSHASKHPTHRGSEVRQAPQESSAAHAISKVR